MGQLRLHRGEARVLGLGRVEAVHTVVGRLLLRLYRRVSVWHRVHRILDHLRRAWHVATAIQVSRVAHQAAGQTWREVQRGRTMTSGHSGGNPGVGGRQCRGLALTKRQVGRQRPQPWDLPRCGGLFRCRRGRKG